MQHWNRLAIRMALRMLVFQWLAVALVAPALVFGFAHVTRVSPSTIWSDLISWHRVVMFVATTILWTVYTWYAYAFQGQAESDRRRRERAA
jgi:predicted membrane protein